MSANTFGLLYQLTSFGESHGRSVGGIIQGFPSGFLIDQDAVQAELDRRRPGLPYTTKRNEADKIVFLSGLFEGKTTGMPIAFEVLNQDARSSDYNTIKDLYRPSHADFTYDQKYGFRDYRGGGRSSGRETIARVVAGAFAKQFLAAKNIQIRSYLAQIGEIKTEFVSWKDTDANPFSCPNAAQITQITTYLDTLIAVDDSCGALIKTEVTGLPSGLGSPVFDRLDALIAQAIMSIGATKGIAFGDGFDFASAKGSQVRDQMDENGFLSNHSGGTLGGISNGEAITFQTIIKPTSSIGQKAKTINQSGVSTDIEIKGRHDPCIGIRIMPVIEAMTFMVIMDCWLRFQAEKAH